MKKDLLIHFVYLVAIFVLISLYKDWIRLEFLPFWLGGVFGTILPDVDHLINIYVLRPKDQTSQKVTGLLAKREVIKSWDILATTRGERKELIFHSGYFQLIFIIFAFLIVTSSGSLFGRGLVLAFMLHLLIDQIIDLMEGGNFDAWFEKLPFNLDFKQKRWYIAANGVVLLIFGFLL